MAEAFIRGDIYGDSSIEIASHLHEATLISTGHNDCGTITGPVWAFHFLDTIQDQKIDGWLHLDAVNGTVECSSIPFLRVGG